MADTYTTYETLIVERRGPVGWLVFARPEVGNAMDATMLRELETAWRELDDDPEVRAIVNTGEGRSFQTGLDVAQLARDREALREQSRRTRDAELRLTAWHNRVRKPVIAAVNGIAMGGGFEIVLACDVAIASEHAVFALPEPRVGLAALAGGLHRLPRQIGLKHALGMLLTGRRVEAAEAMRLGIVNEVVPAGELAASARRWADAILECSPVSVRATREVALEGLAHASLEEAMAAHYPAIGALVRSEDFREGPLAFAQKRKPQWKGR